jgi:NADH:ubiquinone oxidoreductase subunit D
VAKNKLVSLNLTLPEQIDYLQEMFNQLQVVAFSYPMNDIENVDHRVQYIRHMFAQMIQLIYLMTDEMTEYYGEKGGDLDDCGRTYH